MGDELRLPAGASLRLRCRVQGGAGNVLRLVSAREIHEAEIASDDFIYERQAAVTGAIPTGGRRSSSRRRHRWTKNPPHDGQGTGQPDLCENNPQHRPARQHSTNGFLGCVPRSTIIDAVDDNTHRLLNLGAGPVAVTAVRPSRRP